MDLDTKPMIIGLSGHAGAGKNLAADAIQAMGESLGRPVTQLAFADKLKESLAALFDLSLDELEEFKHHGWCAVEIGKPSERDAVRNVKAFGGREILQRYGTEAHRDVFGTEFWLQQLEPELSKSGDIVVTDIRLVNEARLIREHGGQIWRIVRQDGVEFNHVTEWPLPDPVVDLHLLNKGTKQDLWDNAQDEYLRRLHEYRDGSASNQTDEPFGKADTGLR